MSLSFVAVYKIATILFLFFIRWLQKCPCRNKLQYDWESRIARNNLLCYPGTFEIADDGKINEDDMSRLHLDFLTSLGVKDDQTVQVTIDKLYGEA